MQQNFVPIQCETRSGLQSLRCGLGQKLGLPTVFIDYPKSVESRSSAMLSEVTKRETQVKKLLERFSVLFEDKLGCCRYTIGICECPETELKVFFSVQETEITS